MGEKLSAEALDTLFMEARTYRTWEDRPVDAKMLEEIWNIARMGATSTNCSPARIVFVVSDEAKEKLKECLMDGNVEQTMKAPVTAIIGHDITQQSVALDQSGSGWVEGGIVYGAKANFEYRVTFYYIQPL